MKSSPAPASTISPRDFDIAADAQVPLEVVALARRGRLDPRSRRIWRALARRRGARPSAIAALARRMTVVSLPARLWTCGGPEIAEAVERLAAAAAAARAADATQ